MAGGLDEGQRPGRAGHEKESAMRRSLAVMAALGLTTVLSGCWLNEGWDAARTGFDPLESVLTTANMATLQRAWVVDTGGPATAPIVSGNTVYVSAGNTVTAYGIIGGFVRWRKVHNEFEG